MVMNWKKVKLSDIAEIVMGQSPKSKFYNTDGDGLPFFQGRAEFGDIYPDVKKWCTKLLKIAKKNDVLMTVRAPVGDLNIAKEECIIGRGLCALRSKLNNGRFLYYLLKGNNSYIISFGSGAVYDAINKDSVGNLIFDIPDEPIQRKISSILSAYDDLIENSFRRIQILEEMAQLIYQEWFVNFRFPGYEKVKFVNSELGKIPEGWEIEELETLIDIVKGKKAKKVYEQFVNGTVPYILIDFFDGFYSRFVPTEKMNLVNNDEVLMVMDGARSGIVVLCDAGAIGSTIACLRIKAKITSFLLYHYLKFNEEVIRSKNTGAAIPHANKDFIKKMKIIIPHREVIDDFSDLSRRIHNLKRKLRLKVRNLRMTQDLLLPKLISGELDVSDLDIAIREQENGT